MKIVVCTRFIRAALLNPAPGLMVLTTAISLFGCAAAYDTVTITYGRTAPTRDSLLAALSGQHVELVASDGREASGTGRHSPPDSFSVLTKKRVYEHFRAEEIHTVRFGASAHAPAIGFLLVGPLGAAAGAAISSSNTESEGNPWASMEVVPYGAAGLVVGGTVGALLGREMGRGTDYVFESPPPP